MCAFAEILDRGRPTRVLPPGRTWRTLLHSSRCLIFFPFSLLRSPLERCLLHSPSLATAHCSHKSTRPHSAQQCHSRLGYSSTRSPSRNCPRATPPSLPPSFSPQWPLRASMPSDWGQQRQLPVRRARLPPSLLSLPSLSHLHASKDDDDGIWLRRGRWRWICIRGLSSLPSLDLLLLHHHHHLLLLPYSSFWIYRMWWWLGFWRALRGLAPHHVTMVFLFVELGLGWCCSGFLRLLHWSLWTLQRFSLFLEIGRWALSVDIAMVFFVCCIRSMLQRVSFVALGLGWCCSRLGFRRAHLLDVAMVFFVSCIRFRLMLQWFSSFVALGLGWVLQWFSSVVAWGLVYVASYYCSGKQRVASWGQVLGASWRRAKGLGAGEVERGGRSRAREG